MSILFLFVSIFGVGMAVGIGWGLYIGKCSAEQMSSQTHGQVRMTDEMRARINASLAGD